MKPLQHPNAEQFFIYVKMDEKDKVIALLKDHKYLIYEYDNVTIFNFSLIKLVFIGLLREIIFL
jgi:hypothetical protein